MPLHNLEIFEKKLPDGQKTTGVDGTGNKAEAGSEPQVDLGGSVAVGPPMGVMGGMGKKHGSEPPFLLGRGAGTHGGEP